MHLIFRLSPILLTLLMLTSCANDKALLYETAEKDYLKAERLIAINDYGRAELYLGKFVTKYPYSQYATLAKLLRIKAAYLNEEYVVSETLSTKFIDDHPDYPERDYVEYILGMSLFYQSESPRHEQIYSKKSLVVFKALKKRSPNNAYITKVDEHIQQLINRIANHEMIIGKFYFDKEMYVGAANRFMMVKNEYPRSDVVAESLYWLVVSYRTLKLNDLAQETVAVLDKSFPKSTWRKKASQTKATQNK